MRRLEYRVMEGLFPQTFYYETSQTYSKIERLLQQNPYTHHLHSTINILLLHHVCPSSCTSIHL